jgi:PAS domain S-box-containing protein
MGLVLLLRLWLEPVLQGRLPYVFFSAAVLFTAIFAGIWETLLVLILGFLAAEWFIIEPRYSFLIDGTHGWLGAMMYFLMGLGIVWFKRSEAAAELQALASDIASIDRLKELEQESALLAVLAQIVKTSPEAVLSLTNEGRIMTWNAAAERRLGFSEQETIGQPLTLVLPPEERAEAERILQTVRQGGPAQHWQTKLNHKDGSRVAVSLTVASVRDAEGKIVGVSLVARS